MQPICDLNWFVGISATCGVYIYIYIYIYACIIVPRSGVRTHPHDVRILELTIHRNLTLVANNRNARMLCSFEGIEPRLWAYPCGVSTSSPSGFCTILKLCHFLRGLGFICCDLRYATLCIVVDHCVRCIGLCHAVWLVGGYNHPTELPVAGRREAAGCLSPSCIKEKQQIETNKKTKQRNSTPPTTGVSFPLRYMEPRLLGSGVGFVVRPSWGEESGEGPVARALRFPPPSLPLPRPLRPSPLSPASPCRAWAPK